MSISEREVENEVSVKLTAKSKLQVMRLIKVMFTANHPLIGMANGDMILRKMDKLEEWMNGKGIGARADNPPYFLRIIDGVLYYDSEPDTMSRTIGEFAKTGDLGEDKERFDQMVELLKTKGVIA